MTINLTCFTFRQKNMLTSLFPVVLTIKVISERTFFGTTVLLTTIPTFCTLFLLCCVSGGWTDRAAYSRTYQLQPSPQFESPQTNHIRESGKSARSSALTQRTHVLGMHFHLQLNDSVVFLLSFLSFFLSPCNLIVICCFLVYLVFLSVCCTLPA